MSWAEIFSYAMQGFGLSLIVLAVMTALYIPAKRYRARTFWISGKQRPRMAGSYVVVTAWGGQYTLMVLPYQPGQEKAPGAGIDVWEDVAVYHAQPIPDHPFHSLTSR